MTDTPTPVPAASERMTQSLKYVREFVADYEPGCATEVAIRDLLALVETLSSRAEAAEARAETARDLALKACRKAMRDCFDEEFESLQEGLMTDADITYKEREGMQWQLKALDVWREDMPDRAELYAIAALTAPPPTAGQG